MKIHMQKESLGVHDSEIQNRIGTRRDNTE